MTVERLDWDSDFFGISIGRASADTPLLEIATDAKQLGVSCVYIESDALLASAPDGTVLVLADERVRLRVMKKPEAETRPEVEVRPGGAGDVARLHDAIAAVAPWSRFARDDGFGLAVAHRMYEAWLNRAATNDQEFFGIVDRDGSPFAFITATRNTPPEIGLIAAGAPGSGAGTSLVRWAKEQTASFGPLEVVTQASNERALSLYQREGFEVCGRSNAYHLWIDRKGAEA